MEQPKGSESERVVVGFRALRLVVTALRAIAWLELAVAIVLGLIALAEVLGGAGVVPAAYLPVRTTALGGIFILLVALLAFAVLYGLAQLVVVLLGIEAESRALADRLAEAARRRRGS